MNIKNIIQDLIRERIISDPTECKELTGGTVSKLYLLNLEDKKYVVKLNDPEIVKSEAVYLETYKETGLLPKLVFVEPNYEYMVYTFIAGETNYPQNNKREILKVLVEGLLNHYQSTTNDRGWGFADEPVESWQEFLLDNIKEANKRIGSHLDNEDYNLVLHLVQKHHTVNRPFLLHGDCGVHNFIFKEGQLNGVIDPTPVIGHPLYDLIYAFCSSPDDLSKETIDSVFDILRIKEGISHLELYEEVVIGLYIRLGACIKHHPEQLGDYLKGWQYWKDVCRTF